MVFDPTFNEISKEADALPDLAGDLPAVAAPDGADEELVAGGILAGAADADAADEEQDAGVESAAAESIAEGDVEADDLPPYGA